jgi:hypothetical protein
MIVENKEATTTDASITNDAAPAKTAKPKENGNTAIVTDDLEEDDKLWTSDVDKELGDLLRDVGQADSKYSDDEEDSLVGR